MIRDVLLGLATLTYMPEMIMIGLRRSKLRKLNCIISLKQKGCEEVSLHLKGESC
jgi:hypothetical protein